MGPAPNPRARKEGMGKYADKKKLRARTAGTEVKDLLVLDPLLVKETLI